MYTLDSAPAADRDMRTLARRAPRSDYEAIEAAINDLAEDPRSPGTTKLAGSEDAYRIRVRRYRIIYAVDDQEQRVILLRVLPRAQAYR